MHRKHLWLVTLLLASLFTVPLAWPLGAQAADPVCTVINRSGYPDNQVYICYTANDAGTPYHFDWIAGAFVQCKTTDNTISVPGQSDKYCEYYISLDKLKQPNNKNSFTLNKKPGARFWISFTTPLYFHVNKDGNLREPSTDSQADPNYRTIFDKLELTYNDLGVTMNITSVDFFAIPLMFELKNNQDSYGTLGFNHPQSFIFSAMEAGLAQYHMVTPYRVLSPMSLNIVSTFPMTTYYDNYVNYCWDTAFADKTFKVYVKGYWWTGTINKALLGDVLSLTNTDIPETHTILRPTSVDVIKCTGVFTPQGIGENCARDGQLRDEVNEALNRSVMHLTIFDGKDHLANWKDENTFYQQNGLPNASYCPNTYSSILHSVAIDHKAYGFPMDEGYASKLENKAPVTEAIVTINLCKPSLVPVYGLLFDN